MNTKTRLIIEVFFSAENLGVALMGMFVTTFIYVVASNLLPIVFHPAHLVFVMALGAIAGSGILLRAVTKT